MSDYFNALLRAAGMPQHKGRAAARGTAHGEPVQPGAGTGAPSDVFDPFDAAQDLGALPAAGDGDIQQPGALPAPHAAASSRKQDKNAANARSDTPLPPAHAAPLPAFGRHAQPSVQAALRWVAAGVANEPPGAAPDSHSTPASEPTLHSASGGVHMQANDTSARNSADANRMTRATDLARTDATPTRAAPASALASQHHAATARGGVHQPHPASSHGAAAQRQTGATAHHAGQGAGAAARTQVHIGTLHVTLDAAATARFAAKPATPAAAAPADPTPRAPRSNDMRRAPFGTSSASALSRSRLPRF